MVDCEVELETGEKIIVVNPGFVFTSDGAIFNNSKHGCKLFARTLPAVKGFVLSQDPKYLLGVRAVFGISVPRTSNCVEWDTLAICCTFIRPQLQTDGGAVVVSKLSFRSLAGVVVIRISSAYPLA